MYSPDKSNLIENLKDKINKIIEKKDWEINKVIEHNYAKAEVTDCLIYYLTGV